MFSYDLLHHNPFVSIDQVESAQGRLQEEKFCLFNLVFIKFMKVMMI